MQIVINVPEEQYKWIKSHKGVTDFEITQMLYNRVRKGTPLPKGHGELFDKTEILRFLKCPKYENCEWKNCFDCNESRCINLNNVNDLVPIIEADRLEKEDNE